MSESAASVQPPAPPQTPTDPMRGVLSKLLSNAELLPTGEKQLASTIRDLGLASKDPVKFNDTTVQHNVATAARDFERVTGQQLNFSPPERAEIAKYTAPGNAASPKADETSKPPAPSTQPLPDPIRDILSKLVSNLDQLPDTAKALATKIRDLDKQAQDPVRLNQTSVHHEIAYAAQDFEKSTGKQLDFSSSQRAEVTNLASTAPGLQNANLIALLRNTPQVSDPVLVGQIRRYAEDVGRGRNQDTPEIQSQVDRLESAVRLAARAPEPGAQQKTAETLSKAEPTITSPATNAAAPETSNGQQRSTNNTAAGGARNSTGNEQPAVQSAVLRGGLLDTLTSVLRGNGRPQAAPWDPQPIAFGERVTAFQGRVDARDQDRIIARVENTSRAALAALNGFQSTEGAAVMNRVQAAARADPGGMAGVLAEMRQGGKFTDLRQAFNTALSDDKGFAAAYDRAATALARYGEGREKVEQIIAKRPDATNLTAKFEQLDRQIGEQATTIPSRYDGKNMLDDITKNIAEIIHKATNAIRNIVARPAASSTASPSP